jgi:hypothetical protein
MKSYIREEFPLKCSTEYETYRVYNEEFASRFLPAQTLPPLNPLFIPSDRVAIGSDRFYQSSPIERNFLQSRFVNGAGQLDYGGSKVLSSLKMLSLEPAFDMAE